MSEEKKELNEKELDKVNGGIDTPVLPSLVLTPDAPYATAHISHTESPCDGSSICFGSICSQYASCTKDIKK